MVGRSKIVNISRNVPSSEAVSDDAGPGDDFLEAVKTGDNDARADDSPPDFTEPATEFNNDWAEEVDPVSHFDRPWKTIAVGSLLMLAFIGWTGFWGWANWDELQLAKPARIAELIALWSVPTCLLALSWLLAMRLSSTEARRFGDVSALLRTESEALESRMRTVNGEITIARSFLAENARELESIGRASAKNLTEAAQQLGIALADSEQKGQVLQTVSSAAVTNVELLRNHLPVVTSAAKDTTNQIGNAGNAAAAQIQNLVAALKTMDETASATAVSVQDLDRLTSEASQKIGSAADSASAVLTQATSSSEAQATKLLGRIKTSMAEIEQRFGEAAENVDALAESSAQRLTEQVEALKNAVTAVSGATETQDSKLTEMIARLDASLDSSGQKLASVDSDAGQRINALITQIDTSLGNCDEKLGAIDTNATDRIAKLAFAINALSESSGELTVNLSGNEERAKAMLADAEKLMLALDNVSRELTNELPTAFDKLKKRFADSGKAIATLRDESRTLDSRSSVLVARFGELDALLKAHQAAVDTVVADSTASFAARREDIDALSASLSSTKLLITDVAAAADQQLTESLQRVAETAREAAESSRAIVETELGDVAERLSEQNRALLANAIDSQLAGLGSAVNEAISRNLTLSEEATLRVSAQLRSVSELTTNLEQRASAAREQFDGIDDEAFARRIALLTESLNSAAIDVAKILSNEVTDTAWAAYLKGDRGVFTRRAVRLLDSGEARIIANHYDDEAEFRDHVNRYIHDFEAMMRVLLSTRDGNAIGVTLLSSDVGKLYVALAQAIDRLRN
jgi:predicted  nucleic acid-binding Zn-ribbon protein